LNDARVYAIGSVLRPVPEQEAWMTITSKLERLDGTRADPPSFATQEVLWRKVAALKGAFRAAEKSDALRRERDLEDKRYGR
jgi:hypothetical protein